MRKVLRVFTMFRLAVCVSSAMVVSGSTTVPALGQENDSHSHTAPGVDTAEVTVTAANGVPEIPFKLMNNHLILSLRINGSAPLATVLDTGMPTPGLVLFEGPRTRPVEIAFEPGLKALVKGAGGDSGGIEARIASAESITLAGLSIEGARVIVLPEQEGFGGYHDAIIGYSLFSRFVVELDYDQKVLRLYEPDSFRAPDGATIVPLEIRGGMPFVSARLTLPEQEPFEVEVVVDLGASHAISLNSGWSELVRVPSERVHAILGHGLSGPVEGDVARLTALELGDARLEDVVASFPVDEHQHPGGMNSRAGNLGSDVLRRFTTTFDYSRKQMILVPNESFDEPFEWDRSGLRLAAGRILEVEGVVTGSPGEEVGVRVGDVLVRIDGKSVSPEDLGEVRQRLMGDGEVKLTFERNGETLEKTLSLRRLI